MNIQCIRCKTQSEGAKEIPFPSPLKETIESQVCENCWGEWKRVSVMIINENKLVPFLPEHRKLLEGQMRQFLGLT